MTVSRSVKVAGIGWVLPGGAGSGRALLEPPFADQPAGFEQGTLKGFSAKEHLDSVKGYLDPSGSYALAAAALALGDARPEAGAAPCDTAGVCTATRYGPTLSAFRFFRQFSEKGPRFASPMIFPHGYPNTPGNLVAIEFGFGGPHMVLNGSDDALETIRFAVERLLDHSAEVMLAGAAEAVVPDAVADGVHVLNGGLFLRLVREEADAPALCRLPPESLDLDAETGEGTVRALLDWLRAAAAFDAPTPET